jgi:hypothetical protein
MNRKQADRRLSENLVETNMASLYFTEKTTEPIAALNILGLQLAVFSDTMETVLNSSHCYNIEIALQNCGSTFGGSGY